MSTSPTFLGDSYQLNVSFRSASVNCAMANYLLVEVVMEMMVMMMIKSSTELK